MGRIVDSPRRFRTLVLFSIGFIICLLYFVAPGSLDGTFSTTSSHTSGSGQASQQESASTTPPAVALLRPADLASKALNVSEQCAQRFDDAYIQAFGQRYANYCDAQSDSELTCFSHQLPGKQTDTFCVGTSASLSENAVRFALNCTLREFEQQEKAMKLPQYQSFPTYWYSTGPRQILNSFVRLDRQHVRSDRTEQAGYAVLIKREDNHQNLWHTMMEIMSLSMSIDVLSITKDNKGEPFFTDTDRAQSQVIFLDDLPDGPYYDLWSIFSGLPPVKLKSLISQSTALEKLLVPLPGGSNPFWAGDWDDIDCGQASLLKRYTRRVLSFFNVPKTSPEYGRRLRLTQIVRKQKRRLMDSEQYFAKLQEMYPQIDMQAVDYAELSFAEQITLSHETDILVGVHGAGLTHGMFMPEASTLVEILPPTLNHKGFKNMARFLGHEHFSIHAETSNSSGSTGNWQHDDLFLPENDFLRLMDEAIQASLARQALG